jgi:hypothetical protein
LRAPAIDVHFEAGSWREAAAEQRAGRGDQLAEPGRLATDRAS